MNTFSKTLIICAAISLLTSACGGRSVQAESAEDNAVAVISYRIVLGKSLGDPDVGDFIASNHCTPADQFQLCKDTGMALWADTDEIIKMVYLYAGDADSFRRYRGELPYGLTFYDPMWRVQEKLMDPDSANPLYQAGLPDETGTPDHMHFRAVYKQLGMTVMYNTPGEDEDAYIYAIVVYE
jgi:hypothetical protein